MISDERMANLKKTITHFPGTFYRTVSAGDVLGLIERVEFAERQCDEIVQQALARARATAIDVAKP